MAAIQVLCLLFLPAVLTDSKETYTRNFERIIGGAPAEIGEFPFQAALLVRKTHLCGGTIIGPRLILTAAHCVNILGNHNCSIAVGTLNVNGEGGDEYKIDKIKCHEDYSDESLQNDIALVTLTDDIVLSENVQIANLPTSDVGGEQPLILSGWGRTDPENNDLPDVLQKLIVTSLTNEKCQNITVDEIIKGDLCAQGQNDKGGCKGDSGSPLSLDGTVVGVFSRFLRNMDGEFDCAFEMPEVYTRVYTYLDWIKENSEN